MTPRSVIFNGYQMMSVSGNVGITVATVSHDGSPQGNIITDEFHQARGTGSTITNQEVSAKPVIIKGSIIGSTVDDMESRLDTLMQYVQGISAVLNVQYASGTRLYNATYKSLAVVRGGANVSKLDYTLTLTANSGLGYDNFTGQLNTQTFSGSPQTFSLTLSGSSPRQWLVLSGTLNTFSGSYCGMTFTDVQTGYAFSIQPRFWSVNDVFVIDFFNQSCLVNGVAVPFTGSFFAFSPTQQVSPTQLQYSDTFITRNVTLSLSYIRRWM